MCLHDRERNRNRFSNELSSLMPGVRGAGPLIRSSLDMEF